jgi:DNA-directed RNA polymerase alpha subunit
VWGRSSYSNAPHKPCLLLALLDMFSFNLVDTNLIIPTGPICVFYNNYMKTVYPQLKGSNFHLPFFHLQNDRFWHLIPVPGEEKDLKNMRTVDSLSQLQKKVLGSKLDDELFILLQKEKSIFFLRQLIFGKYFKDYLQSALMNAHTANGQIGQAEDLKESATFEEDEKFCIRERIDSYKSKEVEILNRDRKNEIVCEDPIEYLKLSSRCFHRLKRAKILSITQLKKTISQGSQVSGIGEIGWKEIAERIAEFDSNPKDTNEKKTIIRRADTPVSISNTIHDENAPIDVLDFSTRTYNALRRNGINTILDLLSIMSSLTTNSQIGPLAKQEIRHKISMRGINHPETNNNLSKNDKYVDKKLPFKEDNEGTIPDVMVTNWLNTIEGRRRIVVEKRFGLFNDVITLEQTSLQLGVTRERVRQLEKNTLIKLRNPKNLRNITGIYKLIKAAIIDSGGICTITSIVDKLSYQYEFTQYRPEAVVNLVCAVYKDEFIKAKITNVISLNNNLYELFPSISILLKKILEEENTDIEQEYLFRKFSSQWQAESVPDKEFVIACAHVIPDLVFDNGYWKLKKWDSHLYDEIVRVLRIFGSPSHFSEIAKAVNDQFPQKVLVTSKNIHSLLGRRNDLFIRVGHGIFGLREWGIEDDGNLANAAYRVLSTAGRPLHIDIINREVLKTWKVQKMSITMAIENDERFSKIGGGKYWLKEEKNGKVNTREAPSIIEIYGDRLCKLQEDLSRNESNNSFETHSEIEKLRMIGNDFFRK